MERCVRVRWLGVAGLEIVAQGQTLLIDPFLTRPPLRRVLFGRAHSNTTLVARHIPRADAVLVTHPHWDHLMDVPAVLAQTGATAHGSPNTCALLRALGAPAERVRLLVAGDRLALDAITVRTLPAEHVRLLGRPVLSGPVAASRRAPLRLRDYRMDHDYSFLIEAGGLHLLDWSSETATGALPADVLFVKPFAIHRPAYAELLRAVRPRLVIPIHWDDFFRPLSHPLRPSFGPPEWRWPPLLRVDLDAFRAATARAAPDARVLVPELFHAYALRMRRHAPL